MIGLAIASDESPHELSYLTSCINYLSREVFTIVLYDSTECVLNRWIIALDKVALDKTDCEGGFTYHSID